MDSILTAMLSRIPDEYDTSEGSIFYDALAPVADELAKLTEYAESILDERFIDSAEGAALDRVVGEFGITRKAAGYAEGEVTIIGITGTKISAGALVAADSVQFYTKSDRIIGDDGSVTVGIVCTAPGEAGNVAVDCIKQLPVTLSGVNKVYNSEPTSGGYDEETDDELRERTYLKIRTPGTSGNRNDYVSWAMSCDGVGGAKCIPLWNGAGTVKVVITGADGEPAADDVVSGVAEYIESVRPVGAAVTVSSAAAKPIDISVDISLSNGYVRTLVDEAVKAAISDYLRTFRLTGTVVSYAKIGAIILSVEGVADYSRLTVNGGNVNIAVGTEEVPVMGVFSDGA